MAKHDTIRILIALGGQKQWHIFQLDVKSGFLNEILEDEIYVGQLKGFIKNGKENQVYK